MASQEESTEEEATALASPAAGLEGCACLARRASTASRWELTFEEPQVSKKREGEEWEQVEAGPNAGKFILKSCYPGSLLVNTTLETQECKVSRAP